MAAPQPRPGILDIEPYKGGNADINDVHAVMNLSANEAALGPSPRAVEAYRAAGAELHRYPDGGVGLLRRALAEHHGLDPERIVCGNGSDELITLLAQAYAGAGDEVLYNAHGFLMYGIAARAAGATPVTAGETRYTADVDNLLAAASERTRVVFLANPNNPTGTYLAKSEVERLRAGLPDNALLVVDAAYAEFVSRNDYSPGIELVDAGDNTVMTRTFSKIYGLAGLRVGWAYAPTGIIEVVNRIRGPFNVNLAAQAAAVAALKDVAHTDAARTHNDIWLPWLSEQIAGLGLEVLPSIGNFILARFPDDERNSTAADAWLRERHIVARRMAGYGLPEALRITVGTEAENRAVVAALTEFMA
ncbi:MAG: histidinol-phosphate transaminase [Minwuiales bacterium]|nr:histidinol-phosphate transaminase [Minwuiales bacterium]